MEFYNEFLKNRIENKKFTHSYLFESKDSKIANEDALKFAKYLISGGERGLFSGNTIFTDLKIVFPGGRGVAPALLTAAMRAY